MAEMDVLQSKIIQQIEAYLTEENLKNDYNLAKYEREADGWIPLERLNQFNKLSTYKFDTILNALRCKRSNIIEVNLCEPICLRRRRRPLAKPIDSTNPNLHRTVVVNGLPRDANLEDLIGFFQKFYPVENIKMLRAAARTSQSFSGKVHLIFQRAADARAFVRRSEQTTIIYVNDYVLQLCHGYTLICRMLADCDDQNGNESSEQSKNELHIGRESTRSTSTARVSFNTSPLVFSDRPAIFKPTLSSIQNKSCLKSTSCATEQILFCQNTSKDIDLSRTLEYKREAIVKNRLAYEFYLPQHLLNQTHECLIIAALNPHCFTIQLKQDALEFDKFQREINEFYNHVDDQRYRLTSDEIRLNLCVICADPKSSVDDPIWNRSQILDYDPLDKTVNLFYVDLGTWDEHVSIHRLRYLIDSFHRHLVFSLTCRLAQISPIDDPQNNIFWPTDATEQFLAVIDQSLPEIELLAMESDGGFQTNLFLFNSGQYICVNDYMIHIKKAKAMNQPVENQEKLTIQVHPVVALYQQLGEILKQSLSQVISTASSSSSSDPLIKLVRLSSSIKAGLSLGPISIIFIYHQGMIYLPDLNIYALLKTCRSAIDFRTIEDYTCAIRYPSIEVTRLSHSNLFTQMDLLISNRTLNQLRLYSIDFVQHLLEHYQCSIGEIFSILQKAKRVEIDAKNIHRWFTEDNEFLSIFNRSSTKKRLPFSNRLIAPL